VVHEKSRLSVQEGGEQKNTRQENSLDSEKKKTGHYMSIERKINKGCRSYDGPDRRLRGRTRVSDKGGDTH